MSGKRDLSYMEMPLTVRLWEPGYRERYYERKFGTTLADRSVIDK
jgi:5'-3' exonuclease